MLSARCVAALISWIFIFFWICGQISSFFFIFVFCIYCVKLYRHKDERFSWIKHSQKWNHYFHIHIAHKIFIRYAHKKLHWVFHRLNLETIKIQLLDTDDLYFMYTNRKQQSKSINHFLNRLDFCSKCAAHPRQNTILN